MYNFFLMEYIHNRQPIMLPVLQALWRSRQEDWVTIRLGYTMKFCFNFLTSPTQIEIGYFFFPHVTMEVLMYLQKKTHTKQLPTEQM